MPTIQELSVKCGVSISTVSKALNGYSDISSKTKELVIQTANEMGYFPNANARALKLKKTYNIGVLFSTFSNLGLRNDYFAHILASFKDEAARKGYDITFIEHHIGRRKMTYLEHCQCRRFDGVFIACADYTSQEVIDLVNSKLPVVTIDHAFENAYSILSDNSGGMKQLMQYIIDQGHDRIAYIYGSRSLVTQNRLKGFHEALELNGIKVSKEYVLEGRYRNAAVTEELTLRLLNLPKRPTCIIAPDDQSAIGAINAIEKQGLKIARDISLAGYDSIETHPMICMRLTSIQQERDSIGKEAAKKLIQMIENPSESLEIMLFKQKLIIGNTVSRL